MDDFDSIIAQELYFERQKIPDDASKPFNSLLLWIVGALQAGKSIKEVKKHINTQTIDEDVKDNLREFLGQQYENITGNKKKFNLSLEATAGFTFLENISARRAGIKKRATRFMSQANELLKAKSSVKSLVRDELNRYKKNTDEFWRTNAKAGREQGYRAVEKEASEKVRGWMSIAVLDNRTSAICAGLHNTFYDAKDYLTRSEVPDPPPRHPHCRSILMTVWEGVNITKFKGENLETVLRRNPEIGRDMMGIEKYRLWSGGKAKISKYIDLNGRRWFRNDQIVKKLGIKSKKRLTK